MLKEFRDNEYILKLRNSLCGLGLEVGEMEYTENNFDNDGKLINERIPTITTEHCEIGKYNDNCYFVFVINAESFNKDFFDAIKKYKNIQIYDFIDFNKTLYPDNNFDYSKFENNIKQKKYLQIQFDFFNLKIEELVVSYWELINCFWKYNICLVNQLKVDLLKEINNSV